MKLVVEFFLHASHLMELPQSFDESLDGWASTANQISSVSSDTTSAVEQISDDMISGIQPDTTRDTVGLNVTTRSHIKRRRLECYST